MICPKCNEEDTRSKVNMMHILDLLHGAICDRCWQYSTEFVWRWTNIPVAPDSDSFQEIQETKHAGEN